MKTKQILKMSLGVALLLWMGMSSVAVAENSEGVEKSETTVSGWVNTRIPYDISTKEIAERYYSNANDYMIIVNGNQDLVKRGLIYKKGSDYIVKKNTEIKVPITEKFQDQPEILGWN